MDHSIPAGAAVLLRFIYKTEVSRAEPECYDVIYGHNQNKLPKPITSMTLAEIQGQQLAWSKRFGSSATGAAQFMYATLRDLMEELKLPGSMLLSADLQDRLAYHLLKRRGYLDFMSGKISRTEFGKRLSQEWASFPVLSSVKGASRTLVRGQSYYAGDGLNKSLVKPETVEAVLNQVKALGNRSQDAVAPASMKQAFSDIPAPSKPAVSAKVTLIVGAGVAGATVFGTVWHWMRDLPCNMLGFLCGGG